MPPMGTFDYHIYGTCLRSEIQFPELRPCSGMTPTWHFRRRRRLQLTAATLLGEEHLYGEVYARLYRHDHGWRIDVGDCGTFDLSADTGSVSWCPYEEGWVDFARAHFMGRVLATAMHLSGRLVLHGSAVEVAGGAVAFLAPKHFGKSTLALAMTRAGAKFMTDDTLPVDLGPPALAWPGVHSLRLHPDSSQRLGIVAPFTTTRDGKHVIRNLPATSLSVCPQPLVAVYFLVPVDPEARAEPIVRERLNSVTAAPGLVGQNKIGAMLGADAAPTLLMRACALVERVPVYALRKARSFSALDEVVETLCGWHTTPPPPDRR